MRVSLTNLTKSPQPALITLLTKYAREIDGDDARTFPAFVEHHLAGRPDGPHQTAPTDCCGTYVLVGEMDGQHLLGTVTVRVEHDDERGGWLGQSLGLSGLWLAGLNVLPEYRSQGYARLMLQLLCNEIEYWSVGADPVHVHLCTENPIAAKLYESVGWAKVAEGVPYADRLTTVYTTTVQPGWVADRHGELIPADRVEVLYPDDTLPIATCITLEEARITLRKLEAGLPAAKGLLTIQPGKYRAPT